MISSNSTHFDFRWQDFSFSSWVVSNFLIQSSESGLIGWFCILTAVNRSAMNIELQASLSYRPYVVFITSNGSNAFITRQFYDLGFKEIFILFFTIGVETCKSPLWLMKQYFFNGCNLIYKLSHTSGSQTLRSTNMIEVKAPRLYGVA